MKTDDVGLHLTETTFGFGQRAGRSLVAGMPRVLSALSAVGTLAMLWVGGHILLAGGDRLGWHAPSGLLHHADDQVRYSVKSFGAVLGWLVDTGVSAVVGLVAGFVVFALVRLLSFGRRRVRDAVTRRG
ncbi:DUF808 family protein [Mycobacterium sp. 1081908.1]|uniref:DUF808 family protein n=1 Tax=Mycobacterium sp. 1081908.1 TaxID=1834066 RepID=UPI0007FF5F2F|nr:DUF808 family protein [Mycobacterium sp. 1081908.1]OBK44358.1 hypothetical protein A5655_14810 [Mycobacterium sp. 1081908.1]